jgi:hypothetical protein
VAVPDQSQHTLQATTGYLAATRTALPALHPPNDALLVDRAIICLVQFHGLDCEVVLLGVAVNSQVTNVRFHCRVRWVRASSRGMQQAPLTLHRRRQGRGGLEHPLEVVDCHDHDVDGCV